MENLDSNNLIQNCKSLFLLYQNLEYSTIYMHVCFCILSERIYRLML